MPSFQSVLDASKLQAPTSSTLIAQGNFDKDTAWNSYFYSSNLKPNSVTFTVEGLSQRSELRQMSEWYTKDAGNRMKGTFTIDDPLSGNVDQLTFMQIHDSEAFNKPLLRLVWLRERSGISDHVWAVIKDDVIAAGAYTYVDLGSYNSAGHSAEIAVANNKMTISLDNVVKVNARDVSYWQDLSSYFKAGVYLQTDGRATVNFTALDYFRTGSLYASLPPSGNFNLDKWKLTLPYSKDIYFGSGGSTAAEIKPFNLNPDGIDPLNDGFVDSDSFSTASDGAMQFSVDLADPRLASTTNSTYARSELRELYDWQSGDSDSNANWAPSGTHTLTATVSVTDYFSADPQVVVGQIHAKDSSKALVKLQWDGPTKPVRAIINQNPDSGDPFNLTFSTPGTATFDYAITLNNNQLSITVDGATQSVAIGTELSSDWSNHVYYFKIGNYAQAPIGSAGKFVVNVYQLAIEHSTH
ncbi:hypothetical protein R50072_03140 [Simiduia litorea]